MLDDRFNFWKDVPVKTTYKQQVWKKRDYANKIVTGFGDVPTLSFNTVTQKFEAVVNNRGKAYALRKDIKYRKNKKYVYSKEVC